VLFPAPGSPATKTAFPIPERSNFFEITKKSGRYLFKMDHNVVTDYTNSTSTGNDNIKVFVRARPCADGTDAPKEMWGISKEQNGKLSILDPARHVGEHAFLFDHVLWTNTSQETLFKEVAKPIVDHILQGYNGCCFAYGQTGSGKTYSMFGEKGSKRGLIPRSIERIFEYIDAEKSKNKNLQVGVLVSMVEIYCDEIRDLGKAYLDKANLKQKQKMKTAEWYLEKLRARRSFAPPENNNSDDHDMCLEIREDVEGNVYVKDLSILPVTKLSEVEEIVERGFRLRATHQTKMNTTSSRSHTVFMVNVVQKDTLRGVEFSGTLNLVDLAGSERLGRSASEGQRLKEALSINRSLSALGKVATSLDPNAPSAYVPYRDSKLTRLLQNSLGGNSHTCVLATLNPERINYEECLCTLQFANRCRCVINQPRINYTDAQGKGVLQATVRRLQVEIKRLRFMVSIVIAKKNRQLQDVLLQLGVKDAEVLPDGRVQLSDGRVVGSKLDIEAIEAQVTQQANGGDEETLDFTKIENFGDMAMPRGNRTTEGGFDMTNDNLKRQLQSEQVKNKRLKERIYKHKEQFVKEKSEMVLKMDKLNSEMKIQRDIIATMKQDHSEVNLATRTKIAAVKKEQDEKIEAIISNSKTVNNLKLDELSKMGKSLNMNSSHLQQYKSKVQSIRSELTQDHSVHLEKLIQAHQVQLNNIEQQVQYTLMQKDIQMRRFVEDFNKYHENRTVVTSQYKTEMALLYKHCNKLTKIIKNIRNGEYRVRISAINEAAKRVHELQIPESEFPSKSLSNQFHEACKLEQSLEESRLERDEPCFSDSFKQVMEPPESHEDLLEGVVFNEVPLDTDVAMLSTGDLRELVDSLRQYIRTELSIDSMQDKLLEQVNGNPTIAYIKSLEDKVSVFQHSFQTEADKHKHLRIAHESLLRMSKPKLRPLSASYSSTILSRPKSALHK